MTRLALLVLVAVVATCRLTFAQVLVETAPAGNIQALSFQGDLTSGGSVMAVVSAPPFTQVHLGVSEGVGFTQLPVGTLLIDPMTAQVVSKFTTSNGEARFTANMVPSYLAGLQLNLQAAIDLNPVQVTNRVRLFFTQAAGQALQISAVQNHSLTVGETLSFMVSTMGGVPPVTLMVSPTPLPPNMSFDSATGAFSFQPDLSQTGLIQLVFTAMDSFGPVSTQVNITTMMPPPATPTAISGMVLDANTELPISGVTVALSGGSPSTVTATDGSFFLSGLPSGNVAVVFDGTTAGNYPFLPEPFTLTTGVNNVINRPIYLPLIPVQAAVPINPTGPTMVTSPAIPGLVLTAMQNSTTTPTGQPFTGSITLVDVPPQNAPVGLPRDFQPSRLISIQPGGIQFNPPAPITWPNDDNYPPGTPLRIWSVDAQSGEFGIVGTAQVQANGQITTVTGGISVASWHVVTPVPLTVPNPTPSDPMNGPENGATCGSGMVNGNSSIETATGILHETHSITPYRTLGTRSLTLHYNSSTADTRSILQSEGFISMVSALPNRVSTCARIGNVMAARSFLDTTILNENANETIRVCALLPTASLPTGMYEYELELTTHFGQTTVSGFGTGTVPVNNRRQSEFGVGWGLEEVDRIFLQPDSSVLLAKGTGELLHFVPGGEESIFADDFDSENGGQPANNFSNFSNWTVTQGSVDLLGGPSFGFFPSSGLYVDLDGSTFAAGTVETTSAIQLAPGLYTLRFTLAGSQRPNAADTVTVSFGSLYAETFVLPWNQSATTTSRSILITQPQSAKIRFSHAGGDNAGAILLDAAVTRPSGLYASPAHEFSRLVRNGDATYTRTLKDGTRINFDGAGRQTSVVDRSGNATSFNYDSFGKLTSVVDPVGQLNSGVGRFNLVYSNGRLAAITDSCNRTTSFAYDANGNLTSIVDPDLSDRQFTYDGFGRLRTQRDKMGFFTVYNYNANGRVTSVNRADGTVAAFTPANVGLIADAATGVGTALTPATAVRQSDVRSRFVDGNGRLYRSRDDRFGRPLVQIDPLGRQTLIERGLHGLPTKITRPNGAVTRVAYDSTGNPISITEEGTNGVGSDDRTWTFTYDPNYNQILTVTDPKGNLNSTGVTTRITYDSAGRPVLILDALDTITSLAYDESGLGIAGIAGLLTTVTAAAGQPEQTTTQYDYDSNGLLELITDPLGRKTGVTYNASGAVQTVTVKGSSPATADDQTTTFAYDSFDRVIAITDALGGVTSFAYWPDGNLREVHDAKSPSAVTAYTYDSRGRVVSRTDPLGRQEGYFYDGEGNLVGFIDRKSQLFNWSYDAADRLIQRTYPGAAGGIEVATFTYQPGTDNLASANDADSALAFSWNAFDELVTASNAGSAIQPSVMLTYAYDKNGNRISMFGSESGQAPFTSITYSIDALDRVSTLVDSVGGTQATNAYDRLSRVIVLTRTFPGHISSGFFSYNAASDLTQIEYRYGPGALSGGGALLSRFVYGYNALGLRDSMTEDRPAFGIMNATHLYGYDGLNRLVSALHSNDPNESYTYDSVGNRLTSGGNPFVWQYDTADQLLSDGTFTYAYDLNGNRSTRINIASGLVTHYAYDAENRIHTVTENAATLTEQRYDALGRRSGVLDNGPQRFFCYDGADAVLVGQGASRTSVVYGIGIDSPLFYAGSVTSAPIAEGLGSITEEVTTAGGYARAARYLVFGSIAASGGPVGALYGYTAREFDVNIGLQYSRARHYDPTTGRFLQQDPIGFAGGDLNLYAYAFNNPISLSDPTGTVVPLISLAYYLLAVYSAYEFGQDLAQAYCDPDSANVGALAFDAALVLGGGIGGRLFKVGARGGSRAPDFIVSSRGTAYPIPRGATGPFPVINDAGRRTGVAFRGGRGGANGQVDTIRIMEPTPPRGRSPGYPNGYIRYENAGGQGVNPYTGRTGSQAETHFPLDPRR